MPRVILMHRGLVISNLFPSAVEPTRGMFVWQETRQLARHYDLRVLAPLPYVPPFLRSKSAYAFHAAPAFEERDGLPVHHPRHLVIPGMLRSAYGDLMAWGLRPLFDRLRREAEPHFILAHYAYPDGHAALRLGRRAKLPVLVKARGSDLNVFTRSRLRRRLTLKALARADQVVVVSEALKRRLGDLGFPVERVAVVPNGVDRERFTPRPREACRRELGLEPGFRQLLFMGHLRGIKGVDTLLEAFAALDPSKRRDVRLQLVGQGELAGVLRGRIAELGLGDSARLVGPVPHEAVPLWMGACDCLILPSVMEGYPNVLVEALACQRPVIATRVGGIPEIVADGMSGILVAPGRPEELSAAMERMLAGFDFDPGASDAARRGWDDVADEMSALIESVLSKRSEGPA